MIKPSQQRHDEKRQEQWEGVVNFPQVAMALRFPKRYVHLIGP